MADAKISALDNLTSADPANDMIPIVDVSATPPASGNTKRISINNILACSPTATLASATISGDLTVRTNKLRVTSIGVGANTLTPAAMLHSTQSSSYDALILDSDSASTYCTANWKINGVQKAQAYVDVADDSLLIRTNTATGPLKFGCNNILQHRIDPLGVFTWYNGAGGTRMTLDSTGLGVGVAPTTKLHVAGGALFASTGSMFVYPAGVSGSWTGTGFAIASEGGSAPIGFLQGGSERMRIDASGRLLVNTTSVIGGSGDTLQIAGKTTAGTDYCSMCTGTSTTVYGSRYYHTSAVVGSITFTASGTAYNIASDYRLKEYVQPLTGGLARINALKPSIYKWKVNNSNGEGFIAHELADVVPAAVTGEKDAVNEDGSIKPQQVDLSKIVPILVAAIKELTARVQTLEAK
jgi:hypothetical protein